MNSFSNSLCSDYSDEDDVFENEYGALLDEITELLLEEDAKIAALNVEQTAKVGKIHNLMQKEIRNGCNATLDYELNEPFKSMGSVHIEGKHITFKHPQKFVEALKFASNVEIYPKMNGTVHIAYTVHGLTTPIE